MSYETKTLIKDMITSFIKDDTDAVSQNFHAVLATKMQDRVSQPEINVDDHQKDENINEE
jgi:hypothetical protein